MSMPQWICCQIGAREHYAIPRSLHARDRLFGLIADAWVPPRSMWYVLPTNVSRSLKERHHPDLTDAATRGFTASLIGFELAQKIRKQTGWPSTIARNHWFQGKTISVFRSWRGQLDRLNSPPVLFAYSYAALELFRYAKSEGWTTVLGQIDPGPVEEDIVRQESDRHPELAGTWIASPTSYWDTWQQECELADRIAVNSPWSQQALAKAGIHPAKLRVLPLAYQAPIAAAGFQRTYPKSFDRDRPLRVLFLGQTILRKGLAALLDAAARVQSLPVEFWLVGPIGIERSPDLLSQSNLRWIGPISRSKTAEYYRQADVFLFPTLSDGFGLTQLEARAWHLPAIVSRYCGTVTADGQDGWVLPEVSGDAIANILHTCLERPSILQNFAVTGTDLSHWSLEALYHRLHCVLN
ncbi:MAG: glycosyltransferase family 4 protein [Cyanobacteria bacterium P01_D01_bin.123]